MRSVDMSEKKVGALSVISRTNDRGGPAKWLCECDCGNTRVVSGGDLRREAITSCGCLFAGNAKGKSSHPLYEIHRKMLDRCENPSSKDYPRYGGRGIRVSADWHDIEIFSRDMGPRPSLRHSVDREDNNGDYNARNCRWSTAKAQSRNRRNNYFAPGVDPRAECLRAGIKYGTFRQRISDGWSVDDALNTPPLVRRAKQ